MSSVSDRDYQTAVAARDEEQQRGVELGETIAKNRDARRKEFEQSDAGAVHRQIDEAERIMRLPTPEALKATGAVVGDPLKGPSS